MGLPDEDVEGVFAGLEADGLDAAGLWVLGGVAVGKDGGVGTRSTSTRVEQH